MSTAPPVPSEQTKAKFGHLTHGQPITVVIQRLGTQRQTIEGYFQGAGYVVLYDTVTTANEYLVIRPNNRVGRVQQIPVQNISVLTVRKFRKPKHVPVA